MLHCSVYHEYKVHGSRAFSISNLVSLRFIFLPRIGNNRLSDCRLAPWPSSVDDTFYLYSALWPVTQLAATLSRTHTAHTHTRTIPPKSFCVSVSIVRRPRALFSVTHNSIQSILFSALSVCQSIVAVFVADSANCQYSSINVLYYFVTNNDDDQLCFVRTARTGFYHCC